MRCPPYASNAAAAEWIAMLLKVRGRVNHLAVHDMARSVPRGTMRGSLALDAYLPAGSTTATLISGDTGTLLKGDALQIGTGVGTSHYCRLTADTSTVPGVSSVTTWTNTAAQTVVWTNSAAQTVTWYRTGSVTIEFEPPTRIAFSAFTAVEWDSPVAYFRSTTDSTSWNYYSTTAVQDLRFDGIEDFSA
jgi:hypothetical protein